MNATLGIESKLTASFASLSRISMPSTENINSNNIIFVSDNYLTNYD